MGRWGERTGGEEVHAAHREAAAGCTGSCRIRLGGDAGFRRGPAGTRSVAGATDMSSHAGGCVPVPASGLPCKPSATHQARSIKMRSPAGQHVAHCPCIAHGRPHACEQQRPGVMAGWEGSRRQRHAGSSKRAASLTGGVMQEKQKNKNKCCSWFPQRAHNSPVWQVEQGKKGQVGMPTVCRVSPGEGWRISRLLSERSARPVPRPAPLNSPTNVSTICVRGQGAAWLGGMRALLPHRWLPPSPYTPAAHSRTAPPPPQRQSIQQ